MAQGARGGEALLRVRLLDFGGWRGRLAKSGRGHRYWNRLQL